MSASVKMPDRPFYFVRHGQSQANADGTPAGIVDSPLTVQGRAEAETLRPYMARLMPPPARIVTSNLSRAMDTANIINTDLKLPTTIVPELHEQNYGTFAGQQVNDVKAQYGPHWYRDPPSGEVFPAFQARILRALAETLESDDRLPMIVAHGGMIIALREYYAFDLRGVTNCAIYFFDSGGVEGIACPWNIHTYDFSGENMRRASIFDRKAS